MTRALACLVVLAALLHASAAPAESAERAERPWEERRIAVPLAGRADTYVPRAGATRIVLFISGDQGWTRQLRELARRIAAAGPAVVVGVSLPAMRKAVAPEGGCWYIASDLELISHAAQKALKLPQYHAPVLAGYGAGAGAVYAALANTPATTFRGGVSIGFTPSFGAPREVCSSDVWVPEFNERRRVNALPPTHALPREWYVVQGTADRVATVEAARRFVAGMPKAHLVEVDGTARGGRHAVGWSPAIEKALADLWTEPVARPASAQPRSASARELEDELQRLQLPLEFRWPSQLSALMLFLSGDGGWASLDEDTSEQLVARGVGVVGVSSLRYFWNAKPPAQVAADLRRLVTVLARSGRPVFAGGFSFGAEVVPVALREWSAADRRQLHGLVLVAPGTSASFEIDPLDWVRTPPENPATRVGAAVRELGLPALCVSGADETDSACPSLVGAAGVHVARLPGSHHFNGDYAAVADAVYQFLRTTQGERRP